MQPITIIRSFRRGVSQAGSSEYFSLIIIDGGQVFWHDAPTHEETKFDLSIRVIQNPIRMKQTDHWMSSLNNTNWKQVKTSERHLGIIFAGFRPVKEEAKNSGAVSHGADRAWGEVAAFIVVFDHAVMTSNWSVKGELAAVKVEGLGTSFNQKLMGREQSMHGM